MKSSLAGAALPTADRQPIPARHLTGGLASPILIGGLLAAAFGLRLWEIGAKSLWLDEGISYAFSSDGLPVMITTLIDRDLHPPLYYVMLWGWRFVAGASEMALRFPSAIFSVLVSALTYAMARHVFPGNRSVAIAALSLSVVSPFLLYYGQEARMYALLAALTALASLILLRAECASSQRLWMAYGLTMSAALYTHYLAVLTFIAHATFVLVWRRTYGRAFALALSASAVAFLPWLSALVGQYRRLEASPDFWAGTISLGTIVATALRSFLAGFTGTGSGQMMILVGFSVAAIVGLLLGGIRLVRRPEPRVIFVAAVVVIPVLCLYFIIARNPKFADRYLISVIAPFLVLVAASIYQSARFLSAGSQRVKDALLIILSALVLGPSAYEAQSVLHADRYAKDDARVVVRFLTENYRPGDVALLLIDWSPAFDYYARGALPRRGLGPTDDIAFAAGEINALIAAGHRRLWVVGWNIEWADPSGGIRALLAEELSLLDLPDPGLRGHQIQVFSLETILPVGAQRVPSRSLHVPFDGGVELMGLDLDPAVVTQPGRLIPGRAYWRITRPMTADIAVSYRLRRDAIHWSEDDHRLGEDRHPTMRWTVGRVVGGPLVFRVPSGTPPGTYELTAQIYDRARPQPMSVLASPGQTQVSLASVVVEAPSDPLHVPDFGTCPRVRLGAMTLHCHSPVPDELSAGEELIVSTSWARASNDSLARRFHYLAVGPDGTKTLLRETEIGGGGYPPDRWREKEVLLERTRLTIPRLSGSPVVIRIAADELGSIDLGAARVRQAATFLDNPRIGRPLEGVRFDGVAELVSVDTPAAIARGASAQLRLVWRVIGRPEAAMNLFVHIAGSDRRPVAQIDVTPGGTARPASGWVIDEYIVDSPSISIASSVPPGLYHVLVGLYDPRTGVRVGVTLPDGTRADSVPVATLRVS